jgi:predicted GIY-YIG superfamily endonuclease
LNTASVPGTYYVYILASRRNGTLYIGVTNSLQKRLGDHRAGKGSTFVKQYRVFRLAMSNPTNEPTKRSLAKNS